jgi:hypothetical protein
MFFTQTKEPNMKFNHFLDQVAEIIPAYRRTIFKTLVIALASGGQPGRISNIFRRFSMLLAESVTLKRFYTFINSSKLPWEALHNIMATLIGDPTVDGRLLLPLDDTSYGKTGRHIAGCALHFDHAAKANSSKYIFGHCRVVSGLLLFVHGRWACLPLIQKLYLPLPKQAGKKVKITRSQWLKTKSGIGAELIIKLIKRFNRPALITCDSWFGNLPLLLEVRKHSSFQVHMLSRLRISAVLYGMPGSVSGKRGRRPKYGNRLASVRELAAQLRSQARTARIHLYGREREVTFAELTCMSKAFKCKIKVVFVYRKGFCFPLITTDLSLSAEQIIEYYSARWKIESGFKEIKHEIGALDSQCRNSLAVENHFDLCCFVTSLTWIYALKLDHAPARRHPTCRSNSFAFADVRRHIAKELSDDTILSGVCHKSLIPAVKSICEYLFRRAA